MTKAEIEAILKDHPDAWFAGPYGGHFTNLVWDKDRRAYVGDHLGKKEFHEGRKVLRPRQTTLYARTTEEFMAKRAAETERQAEEAERKARKQAARLREVEFLTTHEHEIRSTIGRVLGVRPEDISTDKHRGTVSISVSATVALLMLDRVSR